jgi:hypothetical protein
MQVSENEAGWFSVEYPTLETGAGLSRLKSIGRTASLRTGGEADYDPPAEDIPAMNPDIISEGIRGAALGPNSA